MGYGFEVGIPGIVVEGLAMAKGASLAVNGVNGAANGFSRETTVFDIIARVLKDDALHDDHICEHASKWTVNLFNADLWRKIEELMHLVTSFLILAPNITPLTRRSQELFLAHASPSSSGPTPCSTARRSPSPSFPGPPLPRPLRPLPKPKTFVCVFYTDLGLLQTYAETVAAQIRVQFEDGESACLVKLSLELMTRSELHLVMMLGFLMMSGSVLSMYVSMGVPMQTLTTSAVSMSVVTAISKLCMPEVDEPAMHGQVIIGCGSADDKDRLSNTSDIFSEEHIGGSVTYVG
ncbi:hypothetical protein CONPUDRAFT_169739 [Coniophora puteana RWD-64-598 SS2]|uniref:Uncharacterized protein n=1 Tax=Coniophora puteana (strain RWD-64-598) TaxID=741705 RepID=A0A5M3M5X4_CONPW|nr:uncharacterized protein CONPUDRAFT_169739 [Coniophora puteana RWD-64-598 SS2]EIW74782.1 hypothetical protein CONPUDRAFT_169739 [Coniophora puteana RWD-64-598 SS2]